MKVNHHTCTTPHTRDHCIACRLETLTEAGAVVTALESRYVHAEATGDYAVAAVLRYAASCAQTLATRAREAGHDDAMCGDVAVYVACSHMISLIEVDYTNTQYDVAEVICAGAKARRGRE